MEGLSGFESLKLAGKSIEVGVREMSLRFRNFGSNDKIDQTKACQTSMLRTGKHFLSPEGFIVLKSRISKERKNFNLNNSKLAIVKILNFQTLIIQNWLVSLRRVKII